jgi:hypothetical protein
VDYAARDGARVSHTSCVPGAELLEVRRPPRGGDRNWHFRDYLDLDHDGRIDRWTTNGTEELDDDRDGRMDRLVEPAKPGHPPRLAGYDPCWRPPSHPGEQILEDTDYDGRFDRETITSGRNPDGSASLWTRTCP